MRKNIKREKQKLLLFANSLIIVIFLPSQLRLFLPICFNIKNSPLNSHSFIFHNSYFFNSDPQKSMIYKTLQHSLTEFYQGADAMPNLHFIQLLQDDNGKRNVGLPQNSQLNSGSSFVFYLLQRYTSAILPFIQLIKNVSIQANLLWDYRLKHTHTNICTFVLVNYNNIHFIHTKPDGLRF